MSEDLNKENIAADSSKDILKRLLENIQKFVTRASLHTGYSTRTMSFNVFGQQTWWHMGNIGGMNVAQVVCRCEITNITNSFDVRPISAILKATNTYGIVGVNSENGVVSVHWTLQAGFEFWVTKPFKKKSQSFISDILVYDQFSNRHIIKGVKFEYR
ncbi:MAG: hypothetical protein JW734_03805 [Candidatus Omnitrophica bacterium]|nr:hypothetical protein [Candidatus Omnitrophota bacterium]